MRIAVFEVPEGCMIDFTREMGVRDLENRLIGTNDDDEIVVHVWYDQDQTKDIDSVEELLDEWKDNYYADDEEEDEEDED